MSLLRMMSVAMMLVLTLPVSMIYGQPGTIRSCVTSKTGAIRILSTAETGKHGEVLTPRVQQGPAGPADRAQGPIGPQGPQDLQGKTGAPEPDGMPGPQGIQDRQGRLIPQDLAPC